MLRAILVLVPALAPEAYLVLVDLVSADKGLAAALPPVDQHITAGKAAAVVGGQQALPLALLVVGPFGAAGAAVRAGIVTQRLLS